MFHRALYSFSFAALLPWVAIASIGCGEAGGSGVGGGGGGGVGAGGGAGGGGGDVWDGDSGVPEPVLLEKGRFVRTIAAAADYGDGAPFNTAAESRIQQIYPADAVDGAGFIDSIGFHRHAALAEAVTCDHVTIRLGHSDLTELGYPGSANVENGEGTHATVLDDATVVIPAGPSGEYFDIPLETPFYYNGKERLVVEVVRTAACTGDVSTSWAYFPGAGFASGYVDDFWGADNDMYRLARFTFVGGDETLRPGQVMSTLSVPFSEYPVGRRMQWVYTADEIDGSGPIAGLAVMTSETTLAETYTVNVALGHATATTLSTTFDDNVDVGSPVVVAEGLDFRVPAGLPSGSMIWLPFTETFEYDGEHHLVVDITVTNDPGVSLSLVTASAWDGRGMGGNATDTTGSTISKVPHVALRFHGGKVGVQRTPQTHYESMVSGVSQFPFGGFMSGRRQDLYLAAELGGAGRITSVACRAGADTEARVGLDYTVVMSHLAGDALAEDYAANLPDAVTVYDGALAQAAILHGDWYVIPLTTPFEFNGVDNLVVEIRGSSADEGVGCLGQFDAETLNTDRGLTSASEGATSGSLYPMILDRQFDVER